MKLMISCLIIIKFSLFLTKSVIDHEKGPIIMLKSIQKDYEKGVHAMLKSI